jgi:cysteinyl-tRNA synthetase
VAGGAAGAGAGGEMSAGAGKGSLADAGAGDPELDAKVNGLLLGLDEFMNDDFNTAKVLANIFELVPVINSIKSGHIRQDALSAATLRSLQTYFTDYLEKILGFKGESLGDDHKLTGVVELLIDIRRDARTRKDYATSDKIRNQLLELGILLKDEKDGGISYTLA